MADLRDILEAFKLLSVLPSNTLNSANLEQNAGIYLLALEEFPGRVIRRAAVEYLRLGSSRFFASPGQLREIALNLMLEEEGIPDAEEAWEMVLNAEQYVERVCCDIYREIYFSVSEEHLRASSSSVAEYKAWVDALTEHEQSCKVCRPAEKREAYASPVAAAVVRKMGGRNRILTGHEYNDHQRFIARYSKLMLLVRAERAEQQGGSAQSEEPKDTRREMKELEARLNRKRQKRTTERG